MNLNSYTNTFCSSYSYPKSTDKKPTYVYALFYVNDDYPYSTGSLSLVDIYASEELAVSGIVRDSELYSRNEEKGFSIYQIDENGLTYYYRIEQYRVKGM